MTNRLNVVLAKIAETLDTIGARWCLVGGLAVAVRAEPRFTRDVDIAVAVDDDSHAEALVRSLRDRGYRPSAFLEHEAIGRLSAVRFDPPEADGQGVVVDVLFASTGIEPEVVASAEALETIEGLSLPVARTGHLIAAKLLSAAPDRPQDESDIVVLLAVADEEERTIAREAVALIQSRGYARDRDLTADLERRT